MIAQVLFSFLNFDFVVKNVNASFHIDICCLIFNPFILFIQELVDCAFINELLSEMTVDGFRAVLKRLLAICVDFGNMSSQREQDMLDLETMLSQVIISLVLYPFRDQMCLFLVFSFLGGRSFYLTWRIHHSNLEMLVKDDVSRMLMESRRLIGESPVEHKILLATL